MLFPSAFSSLLPANELDLSSMFSKRTVSGWGGQTTRKTQEEPLEALLFHLMSFNCSAPLPPLRLVQTETQLSWTWRIRFLKLAPPTVSFLCSVCSPYSLAATATKKGPSSPFYANTNACQLQNVKT